MKFRIQTRSKTLPAIEIPECHTVEADSHEAAVEKVEPKIKDGYKISAISKIQDGGEE